MNDTKRSFAIGARVSAKLGRVGTVVGRSSYATCVRVQWEHRKTPETVPVELLTRIGEVPLTVTSDDRSHASGHGPLTTMRTQPGADPRQGEAHANNFAKLPELLGRS
jgi:hypothetical protein